MSESTSLTGQITSFSRRWTHNIDNIILCGQADSVLRATIIDELDALSRFMVEAKVRLNACTPFLRLPAEILRVIVALVAKESIPFYQHSGDCLVHTSRCSPPLGWISLTHVCKILRKAILDYHALWAGLICTFPGAEADFCSRAGRRPLTLRLSDFSGRCKHFRSQADFVRDKIYRAQTIIFQFPEPARTPFPNQYSPPVIDPALFSGKDFPYLEILDISFDPSRKWKLITDDVFDLLPMQSPLLQHLTLQDYYIPFQGQTLLHLDIQWSYESGQSLPRSPQFFAMLSTCKLLESLNLDGFIPDIDPSATPMVALPSLNRLRLSNKVDRCLALWRLLNVPTATTIELKCTSNTEQSISPFAEAFTQCLKTKPGSTVIGLKIIRERSNEVSVTTYTMPSNSETSYVQACDLKPYVSFSFEDEEDEDVPMEEPLEDFTTIFGTSHVQYLSLGPTDFLFMDGNVDTWIASLSPLDRLTALKLSGNMVGVICRALMVTSSAEPPFLPALRSLVIGWLDFRPEDEDFDTELPMVSRTELVQMVFLRKCAGFPLERVQIESAVNEDEVRMTLLPRLRTIVPDVAINWS